MTLQDDVTYSWPMLFEHTKKDFFLNELFVSLLEIIAFILITFLCDIGVIVEVNILLPYIFTGKLKKMQLSK